MIDGKWNRDAVSAKHGAGIAAIGDDDLFGSDDGDDGGGSDGVALRGLKFAATSGDGNAAAAAVADFLIHLRETLDHRLFP